MLALTLMILFGFSDDIFSFEMRYKQVAPAISCIPLLLIFVKKFRLVLMKSEFLKYSTIGAVLYANLVVVNIFSTNSIYYYGGVNGLQVGQCLIISLFIMFHNLLMMQANATSSETF